MLNLDKLALVVNAAERYLQGLDTGEWTDEHKEMLAACRLVAETGMAAEAENEIPVDIYTKRRGGWTQVHSGRRFFPFDSQPSDVDPVDIAWGLAGTNRFGGQVGTYNVAMHSFRVMQVVEYLARQREMPFDSMLRAYSLLHDAHEALTGVGDVQSPSKRHLPRVKELEAMVQLSIWGRFHLPPPPPDIAEIIKTADVLMLLIEAEEFFPDHWHLWPVANQPHAELNVEVREAAQLPPDWWLPENMFSMPRDALLQELVQLEAEFAALEAVAVPPEEMEDSGNASWREEIKITNLSDFPDELEVDVDDIFGPRTG